MGRSHDPHPGPSSRTANRAVSMTILRGVTMLVGAVLLVAGVTLLSAFASWRFAPVAVSSGNDEAWSGASSPRSVSVTIDVGTRVEAELDLEVSNDDPILQDRAQRALYQSPYLIMAATGAVRIEGAGGSAYPVPTAVTTTTGPETSHLTLRLISDDLEAAEAPFRIVYLVPVHTESEVSVETDDAWVVSSAAPRHRIDTQTASSASTVPWRAQAPSEVVFGIASPDAPVTGPVPSSTGRAWWWDTSGAAALVWTFLVWAGFYLLLLRDRRASSAREAATPAPWTALGPLVGVLGLFSLTRYLGVLQEVLGSRSGPGTVALDTPAQQIADLSLGGTPVLAAVGLGFAWGWSMTFRPGQRRAVSRWWALGAGAACVASCTALLVALFAIPGADHIGTPTQSSASSAAALIGAGGAVLVGAAVLIRTLSGRHGLLGAVATLSVSACFVALSETYRIPWAALAAHLLVVAVIVLALCALVNRVAHDIGSTSRTVRTWLILGTASFVVATTGPRLFAESEHVGLSEAGALSDLFASALTIALATLLVVGVTRARPALGEWIRRGLFLVAVVAFLRFVTFGGVPLSLVAGAALIGALLIRRDAETAWFPAGGPAVAASVREFVREVGSQRMDRDFADGLRKAISKGSIGADRLEETKSAIARVHYEPRVVPASSMSTGGAPVSALRRGAFGAAVATVAGAPFALESIRHILDTSDDRSGPFVLVALLGALLALRFPVYGFAFGFLFPVLRGHRGLSKALLTAFVLVVTEAIVLLIPFSDANLQGVLLLRVLQLLTVFLALGFAFDLRSLRSADLGLDRVGDIYSVNRFVVWGAGILVAAAAAFATSLLGSAADTLLRAITAVSS
ncbi:hypothetical protein EQW78_10840 [Oerskovia turbata]|uniref:Uncharacterized protein n=1 Tax=Oerskovia turbata TaxID=1713 RepID=A0A4Q1KVH0_9CELL|nr:hypothetical protein [Oerskovia turbata]RXR23745.1 hypothetical protein EQW73_14060 [Oerskovia turbata]RXR33785.1 hypothetical protein EQW78_10840 [Oerskovia turbata]TGJ96805.1 hypothetical protein DLJ96_01670 [Actinotalea fermentans ATCC 43279 = JCM 9966 = DSM 3133]